MSDLRPLSSCKGAIRHLLLAFWGSSSNAKLYFEGLLGALEDGVQLTILVRELGPEDRSIGQQHAQDRLEEVRGAFEELYQGGLSAAMHGKSFPMETFLVPSIDAKAMLEQLVKDQGIGLNSCMCLLDFNGRAHGHRKFIQDPFAVLHGGGSGTVLLEPMQARENRTGYQAKTPRLGDAFAAECLAMERGYLIRPTKLTFEGGDVLVVGKRLLVGRDVVERAVKGSLLERCEVIELLRKDFGVDEVVVVGNEKHVLPFWGMNKDEDKQKYGCQPFYHLDLYLTVVDDVGKLLLAEPKAMGELTKQYEAELGRLNESLDEVLSQLENAGFEVGRVPLGIDLDRTPARILSFNNVLVEAEENSKRVYLPVYGKPYKRFDKQAKRAWESHGFEVREVKGSFVCLADQGASLHCISKVLERG